MSSPLFEILPSIDVRAGKVVDLYQGDFARETVYDETAEGVGEQFATSGARWIHVVDLDGSRDGTGQNHDLIRRVTDIARRHGVSVELGGGIRSADAVARALDLGVARAVIGTAAVETPEVVDQSIARFGPEAVVVGIDSRSGLVATRGWTSDSRVEATQMAREMVDRGVVRFVCTDITRDSTLTAPNFEALADIYRAVTPMAHVIASGGVTTLDQVRRLREMHLEGAIIGSALYAGKMRLEDAIQVAKDASVPDATGSVDVAGAKKR